jgi:hypothetical protein
MTAEEPRYADAREVERQAERWTDEILECRTDGHYWRPARATHHTAYRFYYIVQRCARCLCERHTEMTERGTIAARWIVYTDGYLTKGMGRIVGDGRDALRLAALTRMYDTTNTRKLTERPRSMHTREALGMDD